MGADLIKRMKGVGEKDAEVGGCDMDVFHFHVQGVSNINKVAGFNMNIVFSTSSSIGLRLNQRWKKKFDSYEHH